MKRELQRLIFGDILEADQLMGLSNIQDILGEGLESGDEEAPRQDGSAKPKKKRAPSISISEASDRSKPAAATSDIEEGKEVDEEAVSSAESSLEDDEEKSSFEILSDEEGKQAPPSRQGKYLEDGYEGDEALQQRAAIDLPVLYVNEKDGETVYKLTDLYVPKSKDMKQRMIQFNRDQMRTQNDDDSEWAQSGQIRMAKRKLKEEMKHCRQKIKHQIKYCQVPQNLLDEARFRYQPGMTSHQLNFINRGRTGNKYENAPHIARIVPQKRPVVTSNPQKEAAHQRMVAAIKEGSRMEENGGIPQLKSYLCEDILEKEAEYQLREVFKTLGSTELATNESSHFDDGEWNPRDLSSKAFEEIFEDMPMKSEIQDSIKNEAAPEESKFKHLEQRYQEINQRMIDNDKSLLDLTQEERATIKDYINCMKNGLMQTKYPARLENMSTVEKQAYSYLKNTDTKDFSFKGMKSMVKSDELGGNMLLDVLGSAHPIDFLGGHTSNNHIMNHDDRFMDAGPVVSNNQFTTSASDLPMNGLQQKVATHSTESNTYLGVKDEQLYQWYMDQKYLQMAKNGEITKRKKYWGEPADCLSAKQIDRDNFIYKQFVNKLESTKELVPGLEKEPFEIEKQTNASKMVGQSGKYKSKAFEDQRQAKQLSAFPIKDLNEFEFFQSQKQSFYCDPKTLQTKQNKAYQQKQLNATIRVVQHSLGLISEEEFLQQECLEEQLDNIKQRGQQLMQSSGLDASRSQISYSEDMKRKGGGGLAEPDINVEQYDYHYEKRKKDLHDKMMKRIQEQEKQNQQTSATAQKQPYQIIDSLKRISGGPTEDSARKDSGLQKEPGSKEESKYPHGEDEDMNAERHLIDAITTVDDNMRNRVTKSRANELNHAKCILKLTYTKFDWSERDLNQFHRPNIQDILDRLRREKMLQRENIFLTSMEDANKIQTNLASINIRMLTNEYIEKRSKKIGINAHEYFKDRFKLSLKEGKFTIFEHIDQRPLFVNNFGMASKLKRYVYSDDVLPNIEFIRKGENSGLRHMGPYGVQVLRKKGEKIPLLGQIDTKQYKGLTVLENNMYYCPVFYHKSPRNDFLCVVHQDKHGNNQIFVREVNEMYLMGQIEPKNNMEVYNPQSRTYQHFIKRRTQAYVIRFLQENKKISFFELNKFFSYINDQILKKIIKEIHVEVDRNQTCSLSQEYKDEQFRQLITPENICQYESAQFGEQMLKKVGIYEITNADKISYATNKFCSEETDIKKQFIARIIEEEVLSTPWNLSQNFNHNRQQRGMMMLEGIGDPSNGHGGYSYLKLPLKISQDSLNKAKINRMYLNPAIQNPKAVTGTDADLRKLKKKVIYQKLIDLGYKKDQIEKINRWHMVALLRDRSSYAVTQGQEGDVRKFARGVRFTSKKQREMYQKQVNDIFKKQINYLHKENPDSFPDNSDSESRDQKQKKLNEMQQINNNNSKCVVELKVDIEVKKITEIPGYEILFMNNEIQGAAGANQPGGGLLSGIGGYAAQEDRDYARQALREKLESGQLSLKCTILRKKIKPVTGDRDKIERVIFCSDLRQIKGFNKRKHKNQMKIRRIKKTSLNQKIQQSKLQDQSQIDDFRERRSEASSFRHLKSAKGGDLAHGSAATMTLPQVPPLIINSQTQNDGGFKIQIGGGAAQGRIKTQSSFAEPTQPQAPQKSKFSITLSAQPLPDSTTSTSIRDFSTAPTQIPDTTIRLQPDVLMMPPQTQDQQMMYSTQPIAQPSKIQISFGGASIPPPSTSIQIMAPQQGYQQPKSTYYEEAKRPSLKSQVSDLSIKDSSKKKAKKSTTKNAADFEEDYSSKQYKPTQSRRRMQNAEDTMNEIFEGIIDSCIKADTSKLFSQPVKVKDAPRYLDIIKNPIDLSFMKNKAKRGEYYAKEAFLADLNLMRTNAETYNGPNSPVSELARQIVWHAEIKLRENEKQIGNLEMLVAERIAYGFINAK